MINRRTDLGFGLSPVCVSSCKQKILFLEFILLELIYNVVSISAVQHSDSVIHVYIHTLFHILFHHGLS